jgi:GNAT superfamily N-acetyltransferase
LLPASPFAQEQDEARTLILSGLEERWGLIDPNKNPDLTDLMANYSQGVFLVALLDGAIVGTGALLPEGGTTGRIVRMSVKKALRSQGLGTAILDELIQAARALSMDRIVLETTATWLDAVTFYQKRGFRSLGVRDGDHHFEMDIQES